jgi:hypothetical protein
LQGLIKRAIGGKTRDNKIYQLDSEAKARIKLN